MKKVSWGFTLVALLALLAVQLSGAVPSASAAPSSYSQTHVVQWGENLFRIALRYGTTVQALANANGIANPHCIYAGQRLVIPGCGSGCCTGCCTGCCGTGCSGGGFWYTVKCGDTLSGLAWRFGRNMWTIANANGITNPNLIYAGRKLYIP